jgi:hypothetical protein
VILFGRRRTSLVRTIPYVHTLVLNAFSTFLNQFVATTFLKK